MQSIPSEQHAAITLSTIIKSVMPNKQACSRYGMWTYDISEITPSFKSSDIYFLEYAKSDKQTAQQFVSLQSKAGGNRTSRFKFNRSDFVCNYLF